MHEVATLLACKHLWIYLLENYIILTFSVYSHAHLFCLGRKERHERHNSGELAPRNQTCQSVTSEVCKLYLLISWGDALACCRNDLSGTIDSLPSEMQSLNLNGNSRFELNHKILHADGRTVRLLILCVCRVSGTVPNGIEHLTTVMLNSLRSSTPLYADRSDLCFMACRLSGSLPNDGGNHADHDATRNVTITTLSLARNVSKEYIIQSVWSLMIVAAVPDWANRPAFVICSFAEFGECRFNRVTIIIRVPCSGPFRQYI